MCGTDTGHYERLRPGRPVFHKWFVAEVSMKLIKNHPLTGRLGRDLLRVDIGVLPGPANFDQVFFCTESYTEGSTITGVCVEYYTRVRTSDVWVNREAHASAITNEWSEIKTQWFWPRLLLCAEGRRKFDEQRRDGEKHSNCFLSQSLASLDPDTNTLAPEHS
jgi:hypothetical protein